MREVTDKCLKKKVIFGTFAKNFFACLIFFVAIFCLGVFNGDAHSFEVMKSEMEPQLFAPDIISTRDYERDGTFMPDGKTFFFTKRTIWSYFSVICVSYLKNGRWTEPEVAPFSGQYPEAMPFVSPDGKRLYFASRRPIDTAAGNVPKRDYDLWYVERMASDWGVPQHLPTPVNTAANELSPIVTRDGSLYFIINGRPNIVRAAKSGDGWAAPEPVGPPNQENSFDINGYVDPDEKYMIVSIIGRADALNTAESLYPRSDLYFRERKNGVWSEPKHLPAPINSAADEQSPFVTPDGKYLMYMSERGGFTEHGTRRWTIDEIESGLHGTGNGLGDIYKVAMSALGGDFAKDLQAASKSQAAVSSIEPPKSLIKKNSTENRSVDASAITRQPLSMVPQLYGDGIFSTSDDEFGGAFTPDGKTVYYTKSAPHSYRYIIVESHLQNGKWTAPAVAPFSGQYGDSDPVLSPDGSKLFWSSDRPVDGKVKHDYDIWMVNRTADGGWSEPVHLPPQINSETNEYFASMSDNGTLYFSSERDGKADGSIQDYRSRLVSGVWGEPENVTKMIDGADSKAYYDLDVMIAPDESYIILSSIGRPGGLGNFDMYVAWKQGNGWTKAVHLPAPFNTSARDYSPHITPDGKRLYFASERGFASDPITKPFIYSELLEHLRGTLNGSGNLYEVDAAALNAFRPQ